MKKNQQGLTFLSVMFVGMVVVFGAILAMKLIPPYLEHMSVQKIIKTMAQDPGLSGMSVQEARNSFSRRAAIDYITVIDAKDLDIVKDHGETIVSVNYSVTVPIVGNLSALMEFEASTQGSKTAKPIE